MTLITKFDIYVNEMFDLFNKTYVTLSSYVPISENQIEQLEKLFSLLARDFPVQHVIGKASFYNDEFLTPPGVFIPRPETEILVSEIINRGDKINKSNEIHGALTAMKCIIIHFWGPGRRDVGK